METFYGTSRWKRTREKILRRDKYQCRICRRYGRLVQATEVHHIQHADERPDLIYDPYNLISLCHSCHEKQHPEKVAKATKNRKRGNLYEHE
jgi:5-methylcytosine-specific restriction endonuclease McrA